jgi:hypothetical protein
VHIKSRGVRLTAKWKHAKCAAVLNFVLVRVLSVVHVGPVGVQVITNVLRADVQCTRCTACGIRRLTSVDLLQN